MDKTLLTREEYEKFLADLPRGCCPFCEYKKHQIILHESKNWVWIASLAPYWTYHTMLIPKRHFCCIWDMRDEEIKELEVQIKTIIEIYRRKGLLRSDGSSIKKYVFFWRLRDDLYDPVSDNIRPDHFHLHIAPDKDHLWDPVVDPEARFWDINKLLTSK